MITTTQLKTLTVNPAFLQEIKDSNPELWQTVHRLEQLNQTQFELKSPTERLVAAKQLVRLLDELRERLSLQFSLEESYGYLEIPVSMANHVSSEMSTRARAQHCSIYLQVTELAETAEEVQYRGAVEEHLGSLFARAINLDGKLREHERLECELIERCFDLPCRKFA